MQSLHRRHHLGFNILTLAGFVVMAPTVAMSRTGQSGEPLNIELMCTGTVLVFVGLYVGVRA
jgi:hypothetical protein